LKGAFDLGHSDDGTGLDKLARAMQTALDEVNKEIAEQRLGLQGIITLTDQVGTQSVEDFAKLGGTAKYAATQIGTTIAAIKAGTYDAGLLGQQDLQPFLAALEAAKQRVDALTASEKQATQQIADLNSQFQDQLDQQANNQAAIEDRNYEKQKKQIEDLAAQADASGKAQAAQALQRLDELHLAKLRAIADEAAAQQKAQQQTQQTTAGGGGAGSGAPGGGTGHSATGTTSPGGVSATVPVRYVHHTFDTPQGQIGVDVSENESDMFARFIDQLARARQTSINGYR
jgi:hypothetical protein